MSSFEVEHNFGSPKKLNFKDEFSPKWEGSCKLACSDINLGKFWGNFVFFPKINLFLS